MKDLRAASNRATERESSISKTKTDQVIWLTIESVTNHLKCY